MYYLRQRGLEMQFEKEEVVYLRSTIVIWIFKVLLIVYSIMLISYIS